MVRWAVAVVAVTMAMAVSAAAVASLAWAFALGYQSGFDKGVAIVRANIFTVADKIYEKKLGAWRGKKVRERRVLPQRERSGSARAADGEGTAHRHR